MRFLLDQGTPHSTALLLRQAGHDAVHTSEIKMANAADEEILKTAFAENRIIVTLDADFHTLLSLNCLEKPSVIRIRIEKLRAAQLSNLLQLIIPQCDAALEAGAMISVQENRIRIRKLPIS
ncbi:MAG: DUF5615 family PIN-like protein [Limisphaerales bacterium]